jgi:hypothetical protein
MNTRNLAIIIIVLAAVSAVAIYYFFLTPKGTSIEMTTDKQKIIAGEYMEITLKITNHDRETKTYDLSPPAFEVLIYHENGTLWAKYTEGQAFIEIYIRKDLKQGESYQEEYLWNLYKYDESILDFIRPQSGIYHLEGVLRSEPELKTERIQIEIEPRPKIKP